LLIFSIAVFLNTQGFYELIESLSLWVRKYFGRFYLYLGLGSVLFILSLALSPLGKRILGKPTDIPEHSRWAWVSMLYSAGMGAGILLRAVQEPVYMQQNPPLQAGQGANILALEYTFYHWGFTAWAFYGVFAIIMGYFLFNKSKSVLISNTVASSIKSKIALSGIDILVIITTVFGLIAAVGLGTTQIKGGINHLTDSTFGPELTISLCVLISILAFISVWKGVNKGLKVVSKLNIIITLLLLAFVLAQSDIIAVFTSFIKSFYHYIIDFIPLSLAIGKYNPGEAFLTDWTYYYWAFWLAWAPFTGIFIARISKGRSLREILLGVLLIPSLGTFFWFSVFGESAFSLIDLWGGYDGEFNNVFTSIFVFFEAYPLQGITNMISIILLISFLVTSMDSAVYVLSMFTDKGNLNPRKKHRLIWSVALAVFTIAIVILGNAKPEIDVLIALQKLLIITSLPLALFMVYMTAVFLKTFLKKQN
jgi:glycine betaine transporter